MKARSLVLPFAVFTVSAAPAQEKAAPPAASGTPPVTSAVEPAAPVSPLEAALQKFTDDYMAAFNKADAAAVAALYDESATYSSDSGKYMATREAIEGGLKDYFTKHPGARLAVQQTGVRSVTPDVAIQTGLAIFSATDGAEEATRFKAVLAKRGDTWRIVELDETVLPPSDRGQIALQSLEWMVGTWKDSAGGDEVQTKVDWTKGQRFLRRSITVSRGGEASMHATEIIGWDPANSTLRSWVFDSEGGFGEGTWTQEGNRWIVRMASTLPDGQMATAMNIFTVKDGKTYTWESTSRETNGEVLPDIDKVEVVKAESQPE